LAHTDKLKQLATQQGKPETFAVFNPANITYFTGFQGATALLLPAEGQGVLYVGGVNYEQAKAETQGFTIEQLGRGESVLEKIAAQTQHRKIAVDTLPIESWRLLAKAVGGEENLEVANQLIRELRAVKTEEEIGFIRQACKIADLGIQAAAHAVKVGASVRQIAGEAEYRMRKAGSEGVAFETIVSCGKCCAYPHGSSGDRTVCEGDFVTVDLGATYKFYRSDISRTFIVGKSQEKQREIIGTVMQAHKSGIDAIKAGVLARDVDAAARRVIEAAGYGEFFVHNLGHGVGLEVHEAPTLSPISNEVLGAGNVVTDEPGIYVPGFGGVRIEDTVLVTQAGAEKLTNAPYMLI
jgi:Xaa-Pro aminopeptidase